MISGLLFKGIRMMDVKPRNMSITPLSDANIKKRPIDHKEQSTHIIAPTVETELTIEPHSKITEAQKEKINQYIEEQVISYLDEMRSTQHALKTSYQELDSFKRQMSFENPSLDLNDLDLTMTKHGELMVTSNRLSQDTLDMLNNRINDNQVLKDGMAQLHQGIVASLHFKNSENSYLNEDNFKGVIRLNEFINSYASKFDPNGFGQDYVTTEQRLDVDPMLFGHFLSKTLYSSVDLTV